MFKHTRSPSMEDAKPQATPNRYNTRSRNGPPVDTQRQAQNRTSHHNGSILQFPGLSRPLSQPVPRGGHGSTFSFDPHGAALGFVTLGDIKRQPQDGHQHAPDFPPAVLIPNSNQGSRQDSGWSGQPPDHLYPPIAAAPGNESIPALCELIFGPFPTMSPQQVDYGHQSQLASSLQLTNPDPGFYSDQHGVSTLECDPSLNGLLNYLPNQETLHSDLYSLDALDQEQSGVEYGGHQGNEHDQAQNRYEPYLTGSFGHANSTARFVNEDLSHLFGHAAGEPALNALRSGVPQQIHTAERVPATGQSKKGCQVMVSRKKKDVKKEGKRQESNKDDVDRNDADKVNSDKKSVDEADNNRMAGDQEHGDRKQADVMVLEPCGRKLDPDSDKHCRRHHGKKKRKEAPTPVIPYLEGMTYEDARAMVYPVYPEPPAESHCVFKYSDHYDPWRRETDEDHWTQRFLNAAMEVVDPSDQAELLFETRQRETFNGNFIMENYCGGRYSIELINARIRMLYQVAYVVAHGGPAVYPKGGDNHGYGSRQEMQLGERLRKIEDELKMRKLIVRNVIEGRGVVAFVENPSNYTRRKRQNKESNERKDQRLKAKRPQKRRRAEDVEDTDFENEEERDENDEEDVDNGGYESEDIVSPGLRGANHRTSFESPTNDERKSPEATGKSKKKTPASGPKRPIRQTRRKKQKTGVDGSP